MARQRPRPDSSAEQQRGRPKPARGLSRAMRGLQGFAGQATAAYAKLGDVVSALVRPVGRLANAWGVLRDALRDSVPHIDAASGAILRMRANIAFTIPLVSTLSTQMTAMAAASQVAGNVGAAGMGTMARGAASAAASTGAFGGAMAAVLAPLAAVAAIAGVVYLAIAKWDDLPLIVKGLLLAASPLVLVIRAIATAVNLATLPWRAFRGAVGLARDAVSALVRSALELPGVLVRGATQATAAVVRLGASIARSIGSTAVGAIRSLLSVAGSVSAIGGTLSGTGDQVVSLAGRISRPLADAGDQFARIGRAALAMATATGLAVASVQALGYAAQRSGASTEQMASAVEALNKAASEAANGTGQAAVMLGRLGLSARDVAGMDAESRFVTVGSAIAGLADPAERAAAAVALLGTDSAELLRVFDGGAAGIAQFRAQAERLGIVMSGPQARAAEDLTRAQQTLRLSWQGLTQQLGAAVAPAMQATAEFTAEVVQAVTSWVRQNPELIRQVFSIASRVVAVASAVATLGGALAVMTPQLLALTAAAVAGWAAWREYGGTIERMAGSAMRYLGVLWTEAQRVLGGIYDAIRGGDLELAVGIAWAGAKRAWIAGLLDLATLTDGTVGGILQALAAGDWRSALDQSVLAIREGLSQAAQWLDGLFIDVINQMDNVVTAIRGMVDVGIQQLARLAMSGLATLVKLSQALEAYDPTGRIKSARVSVQLAAATSGLSGAAIGDTAARQAQREADAGARAQERRNALDERNRFREWERGTMAEQRAGLAAGAAGKAGGAWNAASADLQQRLGEAAAAALKAEADRQDAGAIERRGRLKAAVEATGGGGFGATFSAATLLAMGGKRDTIAERAAKAAEAVPGKLQELIALEKQRQQAERAKQLEFVA